MTQTAELATQFLIRGRQIKFTPERIQQIKNLVERGKSREEIAELIGVTVGSLQVTCSRLGISLRHLLLAPEPVRCGERNRVLRSPRQTPVVVTVRCCN
jgi:hypothetical protein